MDKVLVYEHNPTYWKKEYNSVFNFLSQNHPLLWLGQSPAYVPAVVSTLLPLLVTIATHIIDGSVSNSDVVCGDGNFMAIMLDHSGFTVLGRDCNSPVLKHRILNSSLPSYDNFFNYTLRSRYCWMFICYVYLCLSQEAPDHISYLKLWLDYWELLADLKLGCTACKLSKQVHRQVFKKFLSGPPTHRLNLFLPDLQWSWRWQNLDQNWLKIANWLHKMFPE